MIGYVARRVGAWSVLVLVAVNLTYFIASGFLDPRSNYAARKPPLPPAVVDAQLTAYNLNDKTPLIDRWWTWLTGILLHWDWGSSPTGVSVTGQIAYRAGVSAQLVFGATVLATLIGVGLGVYTAMRQYQVSDRVLQAISIFFINLPVAVIGLAVVLIGITINQKTGHSVVLVSGARSIDVTGSWPTVLDRLKHHAVAQTGVRVLGARDDFRVAPAHRDGREEGQARAQQLESVLSTHGHWRSLRSNRSFPVLPPGRTRRVRRPRRSVWRSESRRCSRSCTARSGCPGR